jgi:hypothetical protein
MTKSCKTNFDVKILTSSMRDDGNLLSKMYGTAKHSNTTKSGLCVAKSNKWTI